MKKAKTTMNELSNITVQEAADFLLEHDNYEILCHAHPDGDTFGSGYGLCGALQRLGKKARVVCADPVSKRLAHVRDGVKEQIFEAETFVSVDIADKKLLGTKEEAYGEKIQLAIDHHVSHVPFAEKRLVEADAAAAAEIVFEVIKAMGVPMDRELAACLYTGIATDTGCFKFGNTTPRTHRLAAELMEYGFDWAGLDYVLFDLKTKARIELERKAMEGLEFFCGGKAAVFVMTKAMLEGVDTEDSNGLAAMPRMIEGVEVGIVIREEEKGWKASLRSNSYIDVQEICKTMGGGGHKRAAGCTVEGTMEQAKEKIKQAVSAALEQA